MLLHPLKLALVSLLAGITGIADISPSLAESPIGIVGTGVTSPYQLYKRWSIDFNKAYPSVQVFYDPVNGAGVKRFLEERDSFGATDRLLTAAEKAEYPTRRGQPIQIPTVGNIVVLSYSLPGVSQLKLSRSTYCGMMLGQVTEWQDARVLKDNPGVKLPNSSIRFVYRDDGSDTTLRLTQHLEQACPGWKEGSGRTVEWFGGVGGKWNEGVAALIQQMPGAIGYMDYPYAKANGLPVATLQNKAGQFITPSPQSASLALQPLAKNLSAPIPDPEQPSAYPIVAPTYLLLYGQYSSSAKADALKQFLTWALTKGRRSTEDLGYAPLPPAVATQVIKVVNRINAK